MGIITAAAIALGSASAPITSNERGEHNGLDYEFWRMKTTDKASMTLGEGGSFECSWENASNVLFRSGKKLFSENKTHSELGEMEFNYGCDYNPNGNSYLCVYGWTDFPMIEYYVVESWGSWRPPGAKALGVIEVDGGTYDVYETTRTEQASIHGIKTFQQYWSVRKEKKTEGAVTLGDHFKAWEELGLDLSGEVYEVSFCVEGYQSSGKAGVYKHNLLINGEDASGIETPVTDEFGEPVTPAVTPETTDPNKAPPSGVDAGPIGLAQKQKLWISAALIGAGAVLAAGGIIAGVLISKKKRR